MSILVLATLLDASQADGFLRLLGGASAVISVREATDVKLLGVFGREVRGREETVCAALVSGPRPDGRRATIEQARNLETIVKAMVSASGRSDSDVRALAECDRHDTQANGDLVHAG
jgi:predicted nucleic acid-binding Zn ribbon protein